ncbi:hypothetical protein [Salinisphaera sp. LB1]|uniref:hypothetical protein n=1 Tax=Salinisphaera sp. LB1 TaxID=2183911 RepID=UPI000D708872|nr:hypothetical protein [Salinisphaera sp. LB1]
MALTQSQQGQLQSEIDSDPAGIGYQTALATENTPQLAALLNDPTNATINRTSIQRDDFLLAIVPIVGNLSSATDAMRMKYQPLLDIASAASHIDMDTTIIDMIDGLVTDGLATHEQASVILTRQGSRVELIMGEGMAVTESDVAFAIWGSNR